MVKYWAVVAAMWISKVARGMGLPVSAERRGIREEACER